jgi:hypothetical protein
MNWLCMDADVVNQMIAGAVLAVLVTITNWWGKLR